jgi:cobalt/nickel transport system permease protein
MAAFIVNLILALLGHGGITVLGLNSLLLGAESMLGHTFFYLIGNRLPIFWRAAAATVLALALVSVCLIGIVGISHVDIDLFTHVHSQEEHGSNHAGAGMSSLATFAIMVLTLGLIGWIIEAAITGAVIRFISQVKPDLLTHALHRDTCKQHHGVCAP